MTVGRQWLGVATVVVWAVAKGCGMRGEEVRQLGLEKWEKRDQRRLEKQECGTRSEQKKRKKRKKKEWKEKKKKRKKKGKNVRNEMMAKVCMGN